MNDPKANRAPLLSRNPRDLLGGLALMAVATVALWQTRGLAGSDGIRFGAGTAPRLFGVLLLGCGAAIALHGVFSDGPRLARTPLRGPLFVTAAILFFAAAMPVLGLPLTAFATIIVASAASPETRWRETVVWAAALAGFCTLLFVTLLGLALPVRPAF